MFRVTMKLGGRYVRSYSFEKSLVTIGRDPTCDIVVDNIGCSRRHAAIEATQDGYVLADLKSHNGTFVDGERVFHHRLRPTDEFLICKLDFEFEEIPDAARELDTDPVFPEVPEQQTFHMEAGDVQRLLQRSSRLGHVQLVQVAPACGRRTFELEAPVVTIGGLPSSHVVLKGLLAPARAAVLIATEDGWRALATTRRFRVNGRAAWDTALEDGDLLTCGRTRLRFSQP